MHSFVKALSLAVALSAVSAAEAHAQFTARLPGGATSSSSSSTVYGSRGSQGTYGSTVIDRRLQPYLEGITITRGQDVGIERAWESYGSLDQRLDAVRGVLTRTQQHRFDQNRAELAYNAGYNDGQYGSTGRANGGYGQGTYGQGSRSSNGGYGDRSGQYERQRAEAQREEARREQARRDEYQREQQRASERARSQQGRQRGNSESHRNDDHDRHGH